MAQANQKVEETPPAVDPQKKFLIEQFGNLMESVGEGYGGPLQEELIRRLQQTISDFDEEVNEMLNDLKENSEKRQEKLKKIWEEGESEDNESPDDTPAKMLDETASAWEKKLETSESPKEEKKEDPPKKKGLFGRKK